MVLKDYIRLIRFRYHFSFISIILGSLFFAEETSPFLFRSLILVYISFNIFLYGGIYTINDIADIRSDQKHHIKRKRPLASKRISKSGAWFFAIFLIAAAFTTCIILLDMSFFYVYLMFLIINLFYSFFAKEIPYLELVVNSITHPLRFAMGVLLVNAKIPYPLLLAIFFLAIGIACVRRIVEKDVKGWEARRTLIHYSTSKLGYIQFIAFLSILLLTTIDSSVSKIFYIIIISIYIPSAFGIYFSNSIRSFYRLRWTK